MKRIFILCLLVCVSCQQAKPVSKTPLAITQVCANGVVEGQTRELSLSCEAPGIIEYIAPAGTHISREEVVVRLKSDTQKATVERLQAEYKNSQRSLDRTSRVFRRNGASRQEYDDDLTKVAMLAAQLKLAIAELAKTEIKSPVNGVVLALKKERGEYVQPGETTMFLANTKKKRVRAHIEELDANNVWLGQKVKVTADGYKDTFDGCVSFVSDRMGKNAPKSSEPGEYTDLYFREVLIDIIGECHLPINFRVRVILCVITK